MPSVTTYGYKVPSVGDLAKGTDGWYESIEFDIDRLDSHDHDGVNSTLLNFGSFAPFTNTVLAINWALDASGIYKQTVTVPSGVDDISNYNLKLIFTAPAGKIGETAYLPYKRATATTYEIYCNDNTAAFTAIYR